MGLGMSFRVAPGLRLRASSRGLRVSVGPRSARLHVGAGRTGVSTGAGPVTFYAPLGGGSGGRGSARRSDQGLTVAQLERESRETQRDEEIARLEQLEDDLVSLHHETFPDAVRPVLPDPEPLTRRERTELEHRFARAATRSVPLFAWTARRAAREEARASATDYLRLDATSRAVTTQLQQAQLDETWRLLTENDPDTVIALVDQAFADNASESTCVDAGTDPATGRRYVTVVVFFGGPEIVPDHTPAVTPGGRPTLRRRSKTDRNALYLRALASSSLATAKEALAVAVAADDANVLVLREKEWQPDLTPIHVGRYRREDITSQAAVADPVPILRAASREKPTFKGSARELAPVTIDEDIAGILADLAQAEQEA